METAHKIKVIDNRDRNTKYEYRGVLIKGLFNKKFGYSYWTVLNGKDIRADALKRDGRTERSKSGYRTVMTEEIDKVLDAQSDGYAEADAKLWIEEGALK